jgi:hypothetical protein
MKKVMFLMAVAGMFAFAACNNAPATEEVADTNVVETEVVEETIDTNAVEAPVEETTETVAE